MNAAQATYRDASRLLTALSIPGTAKTCPEAVVDFGGLIMFSRRESEERPELRLEEFLDLDDSCTIEEAFCAVFAAYADDEKYETLANGNGYLAGIAVEFDPTLVAATLHLHGHKYYFHHRNVSEQSEAQVAFDPSTAREGWEDEPEWKRYQAATAEFQRMHDRYFRGIRTISTIAGPELEKISSVIAGHRPPYKSLKELLADDLNATIASLNAVFEAKQ